MIIIGIDPGTRHTGLAVIDYNVGSTPSILFLDTIEFAEVCDSIFLAAETYSAVKLVQHKFSPDLIAIEDFVFQGRITTYNALHVHRIIGALSVLWLTCPVVLYAAADWKHDLAGLPRPRQKHLTPTTSKSMLDARVRQAVELRCDHVFRGKSEQHCIDAAGVALVAGDRVVVENREEKGKKYVN